MKTLVLLTCLVVSIASAGETVSVGGIEPPSEYNAHWQIIPGGGVGCVRDGMSVYGSNDRASLVYRHISHPINLCGYDGVYLNVQHSMTTADDGDRCELYLNGILFHTFEDTDGSTTWTAMLDEYYGETDLQIGFRWVSDETGVDEGFRMTQFTICGADWGEGTYTNIFTWGSSEVTGHQTCDASAMSEPWMACMSFEYGTDLDTQGWWALDNVELLADGVSVLPLQGGGYGVEDFSSGGWYQDRHGLSGEWEIGTDHATGDMSGANWQCDSAARPGWRYEAETFTPWVAVYHKETVALEFDTWWSPVGTGESASLGCYTTGGHIIYMTTFGDLDDWRTSDHGSDVAETSWGAIKAGF
ncbi:MAG: hypothetical protein A2Y64_07405 [Candidatus Coatesbacteria bacterium RBG_13_66_14]|uniref:Uncharacterized protein n=1 Tax=Candidatus Coatesbacteria bacterium RBG_13_66_14 TaxID=1817816 RepID=A0A1F5F711_9BACT|nr:MAG: hypothetical protein A2Y64_07405 [Candidatus Coatesbacteria bacterium RBG_13_66_14]